MSESFSPWHDVHRASAAPWKQEPPVDPLSAVKENILQAFNDSEEPLFAILDGARNERIGALLAEFGAPARFSVDLADDGYQCGRPDEPLYQSLYIGRMAAEAAEQGPIWVRLPSGSALLRALVNEGWGRCLGDLFVQQRELSTGLAALSQVSHGRNAERQNCIVPLL